MDDVWVEYEGWWFRGGKGWAWDWDCIDAGVAKEEG